MVTYRVRPILKSSRTTRPGSGKVVCAPYHANMIRRQGVKGQELVEFAVMLPLLILFLVGVFDIARMFNAAIALTNAAREGARYATLNRDDCTAIRNAAIQEAANSGIELDYAKVDVVPCPASSGNPVQVTTGYTFRWFISYLFTDATIEMRRTAQMLIP